MKTKLLFIVIILSQFTGKAQNDSAGYFFVGLKISGITYENKNLSVPNCFFNKGFGGFIHMTKGKINYKMNIMTGKLLNVNNNLNPEQNICIDINSFSLKIERNILKGKYPVSLKVGVSVGVLFSTIKLDSLTENLPYFVWSDGTIRNEPENYENLSSAVIIGRDYTYETRIAQPTNFYIGPGVSASLKMTNRISFGVSSYYNFILSPGQYQTKRSMVTGFFLSYRFTGGWKALKEKKLKAKKLDEIMYLDTDGDGVNDLIDENPQKNED